MVYIDVTLRCDKCGRIVAQQVKLKNDLRPDLNDPLDGWYVTLSDHYFRVFCPDHAGLR